MRMPPTYGPSAPAPPATAPHTANAMPRSRPRNVAEMIDSVAGSIMAAPMPSRNDSPAKSCSGDCDTDAMNEPTANSVAPAKKSFRRPMMSPNRPKLINSDAKISEYPEITHCSDDTCVWNSRMIVGTATLRIVLSSTMMNSELDKMTSAIHRFGSAGPAGAAQPAGAVGAGVVVMRCAGLSDRGG